MSSWTFASYRERGILRRLATTPVHPLSLLAAQLHVHVGVLVVSIGLTATVAATVFGVAAPRQPAGALPVLALGMLALYALGVAIAAIAPKASSRCTLSSSPSGRLPRSRSPARGSAGIDCPLPLSDLAPPSGTAASRTYRPPGGGSRIRSFVTRGASPWMRHRSSPVA